LTPPGTQNVGQVVKEMLTLEIIGTLGLLFGLLVCAMLASQLARTPVPGAHRTANAW
jgi:uncharacterized protein YacL